MKKNQTCKIGLLVLTLSLFAPCMANAMGQPAGQASAKETQLNKHRIKGVVSDETGEPLIGVSVLVRGTAIGASTNIGTVV